MPRATSTRFNSHAHEKAPSTSSSAKTRAGSATTGKGAMNPIFNTDTLGQHILKSPHIVDKANLRASDVVLEVGPGTGNLTVRILEKCKSCTAVEMDPRMAAELSKRVQGKPEQRKLNLLVGDFVKTDLPYFDVCISNTPYQVSPHRGLIPFRRLRTYFSSVSPQISSPIVFKLLSQRPLFRVAILMFQREFAMRLVARPGSTLWNRLSVNVQLYAKVDHIMKVSRNNFRPPPLVESSVVRIAPLDPPPPVRFEEFDGLTRICFGRRNKIVRSNFTAKGVEEMLENNYKAWCAENEQMIEDDFNISTLLAQVLEESGFAEQRAAKMDVDDFLKLLTIFHKYHLHFA
ncbi:BZ3500_MvSof-1268-A1-R1_Chr12-3g04034 [Microbotryum saponariae]|uniref:rRNA adenine N(6)-methyltransferase n=1 Tax=Microbotryum saponariae TaxID=289078 RepID=A0A2X0KLZ9_9BASI|nr:BZ3500_MvSof-1268-A1-R1_Chr12-3g04034 [Microbotryum saponariae]SDA02576.1 BZ3501_MvSof-1269-A2-R1_Chr12-3g03689 [Microbotryum saponariae]